MKRASYNRLTVWIGTAVACVAMVVVGWHLGDPSARSGAQGESGAAPKKGVRSKVHAHWARVATAQGRVNGISQLGTTEERMRSTIALASTLPSSEFGNWLSGSWFSYRDGFELTLFRKLVEERWRLEDPEGYVAWCLQEGESGAEWATGNPRGAATPILVKWAVDDPERLRAFFDEHPNDQLEAEMISRLAEENPALAIEHLQAMLARGVRNNYRLQSAVTELAKLSPGGMEAILDTLTDSVRLQAETALVGTSLSESFEETMRDLWVRPDGWKLFSANLSNVEGGSEKLLKMLSELPASWRHSLNNTSLYGMFRKGDPEPWVLADYEAAGFAPEQGETIRGRALQSLVSKNPARALELMAEIDLGEGERIALISLLFQRVQSDPEKTEEMMAKLDTDADREVARKIVEAAANPTPRREYKTPDEWIEGIVSGEGEGERMSRYALVSALRQWDQEKIGELTERFGAMELEEKNQMTEVISGNRGSDLARVPLELAGVVIQHMLENSGAASAAGNGPGPSERDPGIRVASANVVRWGNQDPVAASTWVGGLPDGEAKLWAQKNLAVTWGKYDPDAMDQWVQTLNAEARVEVGKFVSER